MFFNKIKERLNFLEYEIKDLKQSVKSLDGQMSCLKGWHDWKWQSGRGLPFYFDKIESTEGVYCNRCGIKKDASENKQD